MPRPIRQRRAVFAVLRPIERQVAGIALRRYRPILQIESDWLLDRFC
jgi:hypothetical protein